VIDAWDEYSGESIRESCLTGISRLPNLHLLVIAPSHRNKVIELFRSPARMELFANYEDIKKYLQSRMKKDFLDAVLKKMLVFQVPRVMCLAYHQVSDSWTLSTTDASRVEFGRSTTKPTRVYLARGTTFSSDANVAEWIATGEVTGDSEFNDIFGIREERTEVRRNGKGRRGTGRAMSGVSVTFAAVF
jgi:hypothetical protein